MRTKKMKTDKNDENEFCMYVVTETSNPVFIQVTINTSLSSPSFSDCELFSRSDEVFQIRL